MAKIRLSRIKSSAFKILSYVGLSVDGYENKGITDCLPVVDEFHQDKPGKLKPVFV